MANTRQRIPKLKFTTWRDLGWHVAFRDKETRIPRKHLFNIHEREREAEARVLYHGWVLEHLGANGKTYPTHVKRPPRPAKKPEMLSGCILEVATGFKKAEEARVRQAGDSPRNPRCAIRPSGNADCLAPEPCSRHRKSKRVPTLGDGHMWAGCCQRHPLPLFDVETRGTHF